MKRAEVIQGLLDLFPEPRYLEVGVNRGETFFSLNAQKKVAVDPRFLFDVQKAENEHYDSSFYELQSDQYFANIAPTEQFDVVYLDGLHTFEQTLRDLCNSIFFLNRRGVIIIDDILPNSYASSIPDLARSQKLKLHENPIEPDPSWMGDVYKMVFFIEEFFQQFSYACITDNHGQMVVWRSARPALEFGNLAVANVASMPYDSVVIEKSHFRWKAFDEILPIIKSDLGL